MKTEFLVNKRESLTAKAAELRERIEKDARPFTADERQAFDDAIGEIRGIDETLKSIDAQVAAEVAASQTAVAGRAALVPGQREVAAPVSRVKPSSTDEYREAFLRWARTGQGDAELRAQNVGTDTAGGHLVPDVWHNEIIRKMREFTYMRQLATVISFSGGTLNIPRETSYGTAAGTNEAGAFNETEDVFGNVGLTPFKMTRLVKITEELATDETFDLEAYLARTFGEAFADKEEAWFVNGTGTTEPRGVLLDSTVGKTASATNAITFDEIQDLYFSVKPAYRNKATWVMNDATRLYLSKIKTGVASDVRYLWQESLAGGPTPTILGRPVISASNMPTIATGNKAIAFGDFSYYYIADKPGIGFQRLNELYAATGLIGYRGFRRTDGALIQAEAVKHLKLA